MLLRPVRDRERQINEGKAYANDVIPKAKGLAERLRQEAEAYKSPVLLLRQRVMLHVLIECSVSMKSPEGNTRSGVCRYDTAGA